MKKTILALILPLFLAGHACAAAPQSEVQPLIDKWEDVYYLCKGNPNEEESRINCKKVDEIYDKLEDKGWCFQGPFKMSPTAHYRFRVCRENTYEDKIASFIFQWKDAKKSCMNKKSYESAEDQQYHCESQQFYDNRLKKYGWCLDSKTGIWSICPTTDEKQHISNLIKHWKVLSEQCQRGYIAEDPYCSQLPDVESQLKKYGYCLKRKPSETETAIWRKCK